MELNKEKIDAYQTLLTKPADHGLSFVAIGDFFEATEEVTPKHILAKAFMDYMELQGKPLHKLIVYIVMNNVFGMCSDKAANGDLGYKLQPKKREPDDCKCLACLWHGWDEELLRRKEQTFAVCPACGSTDIVYLTD